MPTDQRKHLTRPEPVKLDVAKLAALVDRFEALPPADYRKKVEPTPEQAEVMRRYWGQRAVLRMAREFGVAENTLRRWAREAGLLR